MSSKIGQGESKRENKHKDAYNRKTNRQADDSSSFVDHASTMELQIKVTQNIRNPSYLEENKLFYDMFPELVNDDCIELINRAVEEAKKEGRKDNKLLKMITANAIYREYALNSAGKKSKDLDGYIKRQDEELERRLERRDWRRGREIKKEEVEPVRVDDDVEKKSIYWAQHYLEAIAIYEQETTQNKSVLIAYHVAKCEKMAYTDHKPEKCKSFHEKEDERRRPLFLNGGN